MGTFTPISRRPAKCAMTSPWIRCGARSAPLCTHAILMAHFAGRREIGVKFPMRAASVDPTSTQLTLLTIVDDELIGTAERVVRTLERPETLDEDQGLRRDAQRGARFLAEA